MKKIFSIIAIILFSVGSIFAQNKVISIDTAGMAPAVKAAIEQKMSADVVTQKIETYGKWAGMGKEIGTAAKEGLGAIKDVAIDLSNSNLGKTVMFLIVWKVAGRDFVRIILAFLFAATCVWLVSRSYFRLFSTRKLVSKTGWWIFSTKTYESREVPDDVLDGVPNSWAAGLHWLFLCIMIGISALIAFP
jgi:hypothetical protein